MLILTRRIGESIIIAENVYCTVLGLRGNQVRLAFDAPESVTIHREEIQKRIWRDEDKKVEDYLIHNETVANRLFSGFKATLPLTQK